MKPRKPILPYKVGTCTGCSLKKVKLMSKLCFEPPNFCYQKQQKQKYLDKQKLKEPKKAVLIKKVSDKRKKENILYEKAKKEHFELHPACQFPGCTSENRTLHHGAGRIGTLLWDKRYFKTLCPEHHRYCELHPIEAKELGLSFNRL